MSGLPLVLTAGVLAAFNPCGVAMLPSYVVYLLGGEKRRSMDGLWAGLLMTLGFLMIFTVAGLASMAFTTRTRHAFDLHTIVCQDDPPLV